MSVICQHGVCPTACEECHPTHDDANGSWMDKMGACRVCGGEIPHGHTETCDYYKLERKLEANVFGANKLMRENDRLRAEIAKLTQGLKDAKSVKWCESHEPTAGEPITTCPCCEAVHERDNLIKLQSVAKELVNRLSDITISAELEAGYVTATVKINNKLIANYNNLPKEIKGE